MIYKDRVIIIIVSAGTLGRSLSMPEAYPQVHRPKDNPEHSKFVLEPYNCPNFPNFAES